MMGEPIWVLKFIQGCIYPLQFRFVIPCLWTDWYDGLHLSKVVNISYKYDIVLIAIIYIKTCAFSKYFFLAYHLNEQ